MAIMHAREIRIRNGRGAWYVGSGKWADEFSERVLKYSEPQYAWLDVGRFADDETYLVEEIDGQWIKVSETNSQR